MIPTLYFMGPKDPRCWEKKTILYTLARSRNDNQLLLLIMIGQNNQHMHFSQS